MNDRDDASGAGQLDSVVERINDAGVMYRAALKNALDDLSKVEGVEARSIEIGVLAEVHRAVVFVRRLR